jgi:hypothetical protein
MSTTRTKATAGASKSAEVNVDVRIVTVNTARELTYMVDGTADDIAQAVNASLTSGAPLTLTDDKGRTVIVAADKIAAVEIGVATERRVGFTG